MPTHEPREPQENPARPAARRRVRRAAVGAALLLAATVPAAGAVPAHGGGNAPAAVTARPARAELPAPTGPYAVGTAALHLTDRSRRDPWRPDRVRELMVSFWYPAVGGTGGDGVAPHMEPGAAAHFGSADGMGAQNYGVPPGSTDWAATRSHARPRARVLPGGARPVVLYSSGIGDPRTWNTGLVEELASRGYVVVTLDHTYEASEVLLPGGRLATSVLPGLMDRPDRDIRVLTRTAMKARVDDTRFVLDRLDELRKGRSKVARSLPRGLTDALDPKRIGMAGQSSGGFTAAQAMHDDPRIAAGINMDGQMHFPTTADGQGTALGTAARDGLDRPFLLIGSSAEVANNRPSWEAFARNTRGWHRQVTLRNTAHSAFTDAAPLLPQLARQGAVPEDVVRDTIGTLPPDRAVAATRAYVTSFFDHWLRGRDDHLLDGPSARFPEAVRVR